MRLTGTLTVGLPPREAFRLFTARGERDWAAGWEPRFPVPVDDDTVPGTVFETDADGRTTTWIVTGRDEGVSISYARLTPGHRAGTVTVALTGGEGGSEVTVTYDLTPLTGEAARELAEFADGYPAFLRSWQEAIESLPRGT
ncbi:SRPBCC family protein [Streptosporangium sp. NPDC003464]